MTEKTGEQKHSRTVAREEGANRLITLRMLNDPGHEWLVVPNDLARQVDRVTGFADQISSYSYIRDDRSFFEGDRDADRFIRSAAEAGLQIKIGPPSFAKKSAACRQYPSFTAERLRMPAQLGARYFCKSIQGGSFVRLVDLPGSEPGGRYVIIPEGGTHRYGVKPSDFYRFLQSESFGQSFILRKQIDGLLFPEPGRLSSAGRSILGELDAASSALGGAVSLDDTTSHAFVTRLLRWFDAQALPDVTIGHHMAANIAINALQFDSEQRRISRESLGDVIKNKNLLHDARSAVIFLTTLNATIPVPAEQTLELGGPIVPDGADSVFFVTSGENEGEPAFFVRQARSLYVSDIGDRSSLVAVAPTLDAATAALYRRLANDVLTRPETYARMQLSDAAAEQLSQQKRLLSSEPSDPRPPLNELQEPVAGDDANQSLMM